MFEPLSLTCGGGRTCAQQVEDDHRRSVSSLTSRRLPRVSNPATMAAEEAAVVEAPINAWAAREKGGELSPWSYTPEPLGAAEVEIAIKHCGVCFTDCDLVDDTFGWSSYPMVPGHEIVGEVTQVGGSVRSLAIGDGKSTGQDADGCKPRPTHRCATACFTTERVFAAAFASRSRHATAPRRIAGSCPSATSVSIASARAPWLRAYAVGTCCL